MIKITYRKRQRRIRKEDCPINCFTQGCNVSSSISFELLNLAVILRHLYGKTSEKTQVAAYFTETSGIAE